MYEYEHMCKVIYSVQYLPFPCLTLPCLTLPYPANNKLPLMRKLYGGIID